MVNRPLWFKFHNIKNNCVTIIIFVKALKLILITEEYCYLLYKYDIKGIPNSSSVYLKNFILLISKYILNQFLKVINQILLVN